MKYTGRKTALEKPRLWLQREEVAQDKRESGGSDLNQEKPEVSVARSKGPNHHQQEVVRACGAPRDVGRD